MKITSTIQAFNQNPPIKRNESGQFDIVRINEEKNRSIQDLRTDCFLMYLLQNESCLNLADGTIPNYRPALVITKTTSYHSSESMLESNGKYYCFFTADFLKGNGRSNNLQNSPLSMIGKKEAFAITEVQAGFITTMFENILAEINTDYLYKFDIIRNYIQLILHEAFKLQPGINEQVNNSKAATRIATQFFHLLNAQFPVESPQQILKLKTARDYAEQLSVHVNHLNSAVRATTGKTTTTHITERIISEAKALLKNTDWNVSEIAYSLGFEYPTYFNNFFKKQTKVNPLYYRG